MAYLVLDMPPRLDAPNVSKMRKAVMAAFESDASVVIFDFKSCLFVDSRGLSVVVTGLKQSANKKKKMRLVHVSEEILLLLRITRFDSICDIHETMESAIGDGGEAT